MTLGVTGGVGSHWFIPLGVGTLSFLVQTISLGLRTSNQEGPGKGSGENLLDGEAVGAPVQSAVLDYSGPAALNRI